MDGAAIKQAEAHAMSDDEIKHYLPGAKILTYKDLSHFPSIQALLPKQKDFAILLYESAPNSGHWTCVMKYDGKYEYFDPYGGKPDAPLGWIDGNTRQQLGEDRPILGPMLAKAGGTHNTVRYQKLKEGMNDCGRHTVHRILAMLDGVDKDEYKQLMDHLRQQLNADYDGVVTMRIP